MAESKKAKREESYLHFLARESRLVMRIGVLVLLGLTIATMITFWFWAIIPAMLLLVAYLGMVIADSVEHYTDPAHSQEQPMESTAPEIDEKPEVKEIADDPDPVTQALVRRESIWIVMGVSTIIVVALIIAGLFVPVEFVIVGAFILAAYMMLVMAPVWLGWIEDDIEEESQRYRGPKLGDGIM